MKKRMILCALLATAMLALCACDSSADTPSTLPNAVTHTPGDTGYIPMYSELTADITDDTTESRTPSTPEEPSTLSLPSTPTLSSEEPTTETPSPTTTPVSTETPEPTASSTETETPVPTETPATSTETADTTYLYPELPDPQFLCEQCFVYDVQRNCFLYLSGGDKVVYPASTTKLLTILYARTMLSPDLVVVPGNELEMVQPHSSLAYITQNSGHKLTVEQLIEAMLLPSGNDAAHVLAAAGGRALDPSITDGKEAVARFMVGMNRYAKQLGLVGSVFITPDGYDLDGHFSTLEDMAIVAREAYKDKLIRKYAALEADNVVYASGHMMTWYNTNLCINPDPNNPYYIPEVNGLKTGTKDNSYYCLISSAEIGGRAFIFGFFGETLSQNRFIDTKTAVDWIKAYVI